jgi:hypothetical protein
MAFSITNEEKVAINTERIAQLNREGYDNEVALKTAESALTVEGLTEQHIASVNEKIEQYRKNIEIIEAAIAVAEAEIAGNE